MKEKQFFRCVLCHRVISDWDVREGHGCPKCGSTKLSPSNLSQWEKLRQLMKHPALWDWPEDIGVEAAAFPVGHDKKWTKNPDEDPRR